MVENKIIMYYKVYSICKSKISDNSTKPRKGEMNIKGSSAKGEVA